MLNIKNFHKKRERGISLLEVLLAVAVFIIGVATVAHLFLGSYRATMHSVEKNQAMLLAKEGIEAVRSIRDGDLAYLQSHNFPLTNYRVELDINRWILVSGVEEIDNKFTRSINIEKEIETWKVTSTVTWQPSGIQEESSVSLTEHLTAWRETLVIPPSRGETTLSYREKDYNIIEIGDHCWMAENLVAANYRDGTVIPEVTLAADWETASNNNEHARAAYDNDPNNLAEYGYLYNWHAVNHEEGICPEGWKVPNDLEWTMLTDYVSANSDYWCGGDSSKIGKALASTSGWESDVEECNVGYNQASNNLTSFSAAPGGLRNLAGVFDRINLSAAFWSSTSDGSQAWMRATHYNIATFNRGSGWYGLGYSVRCVMVDPTTTYTDNIGNMWTPTLELPVDGTGDTDYQWGCAGTTVGAISSDDGRYNMGQIIYYGTTCDVVPIAAQQCADLEYAGYNDWYLPAVDTVEGLYNECITNQGKVAGDPCEPVYDDNARSFAHYWSSTEQSSTSAYRVSFYTGNVAYHDKSSNNLVRCIR